MGFTDKSHRRKTFSTAVHSRTVSYLLLGSFTSRCRRSDLSRASQQAKTRCIYVAREEPCFVHGDANHGSCATAEPATWTTTNLCATSNIMRSHGLVPEVPPGHVYDSAQSSENWQDVCHAITPFMCRRPVDMYRANCSVRLMALSRIRQSPVASGTNCYGPLVPL